jgi:acyl dehydratase
MEFAEGQSASIVRTIDAADLQAMERLSKSAAFASHQLLSDALADAAAASLSGAPTFPLSRFSRFVRPIEAGDTLTATATLISFEPQDRLLTVRTLCTDQHGHHVAEGQTVLQAVQS